MNIRFHTEIRNGNIIVPDEFRAKLGDDVPVEVEVIVQNGSDAGVADSEDFLAYLMKNPISFEGSPLTREEIYAERLR